jgi:hypothetical protein
MMKFAAILAIAGSAAAFAPAKQGTASSALKAVPWSPDESKFAFGLPGAIPPFEEGFDPLGFADAADLSKLKEYREAELQHGRVAMLAALGMLVTEEPIEYHPLFEASVKDIGPAIRHLDEVRAVSPFFFELLGILIGALELNRALKGWKSPDIAIEGFLRDDYYPGDVSNSYIYWFGCIQYKYSVFLNPWTLVLSLFFPQIGFDPLGLKPDDPEAFAEIQTKELQNGRLAMLGAMGMIAQELVNGEEIFVNLGLAPNRFDPSSVPVQF